MTQANTDAARIDDKLARTPSTPADRIAIKPLSPFVGSFQVADPSESDALQEFKDDQPDGSIRKMRRYLKRIRGEVVYQRQLTPRELERMKAGSPLPATVEVLKPAAIASSHFHGRSSAADQPTVCIQNPAPENARVVAPWWLCKSLIARGLAEPYAAEDAKRLAALEREHAKAQTA